MKRWPTLLSAVAACMLTLAAAPTLAEEAVETLLTDDAPVIPSECTPTVDGVNDNPMSSELESLPPAEGYPWASANFPFLRWPNLVWWPSIRDEKTSQVVENLARQEAAVEARQQRLIEATYWRRYSQRNGAVDPLVLVDGVEDSEYPEIAVVPKSRYFLEPIYCPPPNYPVDHFGFTANSGFAMRMYDRTANTMPIVGGYQAPVTQNMSPVPSNRAFYTQTIVPDVYPRSGGFQNFTFGLERTMEMFGEQMGLVSIEIRIPFSVQPALYQTENTAGLPRDNYIRAEFGNLCFILKGLLCGDCRQSLTAGLGINVPTQPDLAVASDSGPRFDVGNDIVGFAPFLSGLYQPTPRVSAIGFSVLHLPLGANHVDYHRSTLGAFTEVNRRGKFNQPAAVQLSGSLSYCLWECKSRDCFAWFFPILELDYVGSLQNADQVVFHDPFLTARGGSDVAAVLPFQNRQSIVAAQIGTKFRICRSIDLGVAGIVPMGSQNQGPGGFDWAVQVQSAVHFCAD